MAAADIHHRTADFRAIYSRVLADLKTFIGTKNDVVMFAPSGTGAMEAAVSNLTSPGDKVLVVTAGKFGERWQGLAKAFDGRPIVADFSHRLLRGDRSGPLEPAVRRPGRVAPVCAGDVPAYNPQLLMNDALGRPLRNLRLSVTDSLGLTGSDLVSFVVDNLPPFASVTSPVDLSGPEGGDVFAVSGDAHPARAAGG